MYQPHHEFLEQVSGQLGWYYAACGALNLGAAGVVWRRKAIHSLPRGSDFPDAIAPEGPRALGVGIWATVAGGFALLAMAAFLGRAPALPEPLKDAIDSACTPMTVTLGAFAAWGLLWWGRQWLVRPVIGWSALNLGLLGFGLSLSDPDFHAVVTVPDNLPIVGMVYLLGCFLWVTMRRAVENDQRLEAGQEPVEKTESESILVWPDLVYVELIAMLVVVAVLVLWSLAVRAPLESPANPAITPNPAKAPWYFVGLQELLCYADAWWVGVTVPCLAIFGLAAIPYLDRQPRPAGCYATASRRLAWFVFLSGFLLLWILPILIGTFMRGPNWSFYGPYETRDPLKLTTLPGIKLSEWFWGTALGREVPQPPPMAATLTRLGYLCFRELPGLLLATAYFVGLPWLLGRMQAVRRLFLLETETNIAGAGAKTSQPSASMGRVYMMLVLLVLMLSLPLKMLLRWMLGLGYLISFPECSLSF